MLQCTKVLGRVRVGYPKVFLNLAAGGSPIELADVSGHPERGNLSFPAPDQLDVTCQPGGSGHKYGFATRFDLRALQMTEIPLRLQYEVCFPEGFDFVLGGKLPGLKPYENPLGDRRSYRPMWREAGSSELYLHLPWDHHGGPSPLGIMGRDFVNSGHLLYEWRSICRGCGSFARGHWSTVDVEVEPIGSGDHRAQMWIDGKPVAICQESGLPERSISGFGQWAPNSSPLDCIAFTIFFGGDGPEYASPRAQVVSIRNMILYV